MGCKKRSKLCITSSRMRMNINKLGDVDENGNLIARTGDLPDVFTLEDPDDGQIKVFVDNGDGTYEMVVRDAEENNDMINQFTMGFLTSK